MKVVIIGSGNVAMQLGLAIKSAGHKIVCVAGRNVLNTRKVARVLKTPFSSSIKKIPVAEVILIAVADAAIKRIVDSLPANKSIVLHTSGITTLSIFKNKFKKAGVLYPLQTINANTYLDFKEVPLCIEASDKNTLSKLKEFAFSISDEVVVINSSSRKALHLAAVIANNFSNHLFLLAQQYLAKNKLSFDLLKPLIEETAKKIITTTPAQAQTGPAIRGDKKTITEHLKMLNKDKNLKEIYSLITKSIVKQKRVNK